MARQCEVVLSSVLLAAMLFGMTSNFFGHHYMQLIPAAVAQENENATNNNSNNSTPTNKTITNNIVQLSVKEVTSGVYKWINGSNGADNPTLKAFTNANNI